MAVKLPSVPVLNVFEHEGERYVRVDEVLARVALLRQMYEEWCRRRKVLGGMFRNVMLSSVSVVFGDLEEWKGGRR